MVELATLPILAAAWIHGENLAVGWPDGHPPAAFVTAVAATVGTPPPELTASETRLGDDYWGAHYAQASILAAAAAPLLPADWIKPDTVNVEQAATGRATPIAKVAAADITCAPLLQQTFNLLQTGEPQSLCRYQGKVLLIVNTASFCGYTPQYEGLEALYRKYKNRGLVVLGFPSNDFGGQEPGTNKEIAEFCRTTYGVEFPQYEKSHVSGAATLAGNALYLALGKQTGKVPEWNFHKYLVNRAGMPVASFGSATKPNDPSLTETLERLLNEKPVASKG